MITEKPIRIVSMGKYLPRQVTSEELEQRYDIPPGWSSTYSGVQTRYQVTDEFNGFMGARAAESALKKANMLLSDIDMLISAGGSFDYPIPNQASIIKSEIQDGSKYDFPAVDIDSTCLSFVTALDFASCILDGVRMKNILIVSAEISSKGLNPENWETVTLFGDAAVAAVVTYDSASDSRFIKGGQKTYSEGVYFTMIEGGGSRHYFKDTPYDKYLHSFKMNGKQLLRLAKTNLPAFFNWFFNDLPLSLEKVDVIIPHQASRLGLYLFRVLFNFKANKVKESLSKYGNCIAASIPLTLMDCIENGEVKRGDICMLIGTSAGFSIGGVLIKY